MRGEEVRMMNSKLEMLLKVLMYFIVVTTPLLNLGSVHAYTPEGISSQDQQTIDQIMAPFNKALNFVKIAAVSIAGLVLVFAGIVYMMAGGDVAKKEKAKNMVTGVVIGLMVFVVAPMAVQYMIT